MPERNADLFNRLADHFERAPHTWCQADWGYVTECGTYACIAGWACILTHGEAAFRTTPEEGTALRTYYGGEHIEQHAANLLGLDNLETEDLFDPNWYPDGGDLPKTMRRLAQGDDVEDVTCPDPAWGDDEDD